MLFCFFSAVCIIQSYLSASCWSSLSPFSGVHVPAVSQSGIYPFPGCLSQRHQASEPFGGPRDSHPQTLWLWQVSTVLCLWMSPIILSIIVTACFSAHMLNWLSLQSSHSQSLMLICHISLLLCFGFMKVITVRNGGLILNGTIFLNGFSALCCFFHLLVQSS